MSENLGMPYLLKKSGFYYAHNSSGYTQRAELAEIYTKSYAEKHADNHEEVTAVPVSDAIKSADHINGYIERLEEMRNALNRMANQ